MKTYIKNGLVFCSAVCLLTPSIGAMQDPTPENNQAQRPKLVLEFETPTQYMEAFMDPSKKPEKSFIWWAAQMILLCQQDPKLKRFSVLLGQAAKGNPDEPKINRATVVSKLFLQYQSFFSQELQNYILKVGLQNVLAAMKRRAEK